MNFKKIIILILFVSSTSSFACDPMSTETNKDFCSADSALTMFNTDADTKSDYCKDAIACSHVNYEYFTGKPETNFYKSRLIGSAKDLVDSVAFELSKSVLFSQDELDDNLNALKSCKLELIDSFPCADNLKLLNVRSESIKKIILNRYYPDPIAKKNKNECLNPHQVMVFNMMATETENLEMISAMIESRPELKKSKNVLEDLKTSFPDKANLLNEAETNTKVKYLTNNPDVLKKFLKKDKLSKHQKNEWAKILNQKCDDAIKGLEEFICKNKFNEQTSMPLGFKTKLSQFDSQEMEGIQFDQSFCKTKNEIVIPSKIKSFENSIASAGVLDNKSKSSTASLSNAICPLISSCEPATLQICMTSKCQTMENEIKTCTNQREKVKLMITESYCSQFFDKTSNYKIKNPELFGYVQSISAANFSKVDLPHTEPMLLNQFFNTKKDPFIAENPNLKQPKDNDSNLNLKTLSSDHDKQTNKLAINTNPTSNAANSASTQSSFPQNNVVNNPSNSGDNTKTNNNATDEKVSAIEKDLDKITKSQNKFFDRLSRTLSNETQKNLGEKNSSVRSYDNNDQNLDSDGATIDDFQKTSELAIINNENRSNDNIVKNKEVSETPKSNTSNYSISAPKTSLDRKNTFNNEIKDNVFTEPQTINEQFKVVIKNVDPSTIDLELLKDEIMKQAGEPIAKGEPFKIKFIFNGEIHEIEMKPSRIKNGEIVYTPKQKVDSPLYSRVLDILADIKTKILKKDRNNKVEDLNKIVTKK